MKYYCLNKYKSIKLVSIFYSVIIVQQKYAIFLIFKKNNLQ